MKKSYVPVFAICGSMIAVGAHAAEGTSTGLDYQLLAGMTYSDNIQRQPSPFEQDSSAIALGAVLRGERPAGRLRYEAALDIMHYEYLDNDTEGETFGRGLLSGSYDFIPENFRWNASLNFDQLREELFQPIAPGNVENMITFSTGPTVRGELFGAVDTQLDGHFVRAYYSGDTIENQTVGGRLGLGRRSGPLSRYGVGASVDDVSYLGSPSSSALDFQRSEAFLYAEISGARTEFSGEVGYSKADGDSFDSDGPVARIRLTRLMSPSLSAYVGYTHEYPTSQPGVTVSDPTASGGGVVDTSLVSSSPREAWRGEVGFRYERTRSEAEIGFYHLDEESLILALGDHRYDELRANVTRHFTPLSRGTIYASYSKEDFSLLAEEFDELRAGARYGHDFTRSIGLDVRIEYRDRSGDDSFSSYSEFSGGVFLRYNGSTRGRNTATPLGGLSQ